MTAMTWEMDGSVHIAWSAEDYDTIRVTAPHRPAAELAEFGRRVADVALLDRTVHTLHSALRAEFGGTFDLETGQGRGDRRARTVEVRFHPPRRDPNPDPVWEP